MAKYVLAFLYATYLTLYGSQHPPVDPSLSTEEDHTNGEAPASLPSDEKEKKDVKSGSKDSKPLPPVSPVAALL